MTRVLRIQTSFAAGELDPLLSGRIDLRARAEGARQLVNVLPLPTGGVVRRPGLRAVAEVPGARRLVAFDGAAARVLLAIGPSRLDLFLDPVGSTPTASFAIDPMWSESVLRDLSWTVVGDRLLFCHPDVEPRLLWRDAFGSWQFAPWRLEPVDPADATSPPRGPWLKFQPAAELQILLAGSPPTGTVPAGSAVELLVSEPLFAAAHLGQWLRIRDGHALVVGVNSATRVQAVLREAQPNGGPTRDFAELAFSPARGWPRAVATFQNRLVIGGSRDAPDHLWMSRSGRFFDFDVGSGLDDEAIAFRLTAEVAHTIRRLWPGRRLAVFTDRGEWVVHGEPVTPTSVAVDLQTRNGSPTARSPRIAEVDGAMLFVAASGREVREFVYIDSEQAWQAADIALLARHLVDDPVDLVFDGSRRQLLLLRGDGRLASCTLDRNANIVAWARQETAGRVLAVEHGLGGTWLLVARGNRTQIEFWDDSLRLDGCRRLVATEPATLWSGLDAYVGSRVGVFADGRFLGFFELAAPSIVLPEPALELLVGLPYTHLVEPETSPAGGSLAPDALYRPVRVSFRLHATEALFADVGLGLRSVPLPALPFTGDLELRALGWRRGAEAPAWRIQQELPVPFTLLAATTETRVNS